MGTKRKQPDANDLRDGQAPATGIQALPLKPEALRKLEGLQWFSDCILILDDAEIPCHRLKLSEVCTVLSDMLKDLPVGEPCQLDGETVGNIAPLLELAYGGLAFTVGRSNIIEVAYCHENYACKGLCAAAKKYMEWAIHRRVPKLALKVFKAASLLDMKSLYKDSSKELAGMLPEIKRSNDAEIRLDYDSLTPEDIIFLEADRSALLEKFLVVVTSKFDDKLLVRPPRWLNANCDDNHASGFAYRIEELMSDMEWVVEHVGLKAGASIVLEQEFGHGPQGHDGF